MRVRMILAVVSASSLTLGVYTACGGDDTSSATDAGPDTSVADTGPKDTGAPDTGPDTGVDAGCAAPDLNQLISLVDASAVDAGGLDIGACFACAVSDAGCGKQVQTCNADCTCRTDVEMFVGCITMDPTKLISCATPVLGNPAGAAFIQCVGLGACSSVCRPGDGGAPKDAAGD